MPTTPPSNPNLQEVVSDARWLPSRLVSSANEVEFAWLPREAHSKVSFLADQYLRELQPPTVRLGLAELSTGLPKTNEHCHYIFHSAFCGSTLLCRVLNLPGKAFGLNEPQILIDLATLSRQGKLDPGLLRAVTQLLSRPFGPGEASIVKPGNEANLLIEPLMRLNETSKAVLLYAPLTRFLRSIARKQLWGRLWGRRLFLLLRQDYKLPLGFSETELFEQSDLQVAALAWLHHHAQFASLLSRYPERFRTLDSDTFLARRAGCLAAIGTHFNLDIDAERWADISNGENFARHSKEVGRAFSHEAEEARDADLPLIDEEIAMVTSWASTVAEQLGLTLDLPDALCAA